jgi:uncharacterized membrane protein YidH (DUF202 family)
MFDPITSIHILNQIAYHAVVFAIALNIVAWLLAFIGTGTKAWQQTQRDRRGSSLRKHQAIMLATSYADLNRLSQQYPSRDLWKIPTQNVSG